MTADVEEASASPFAATFCCCCCCRCCWSKESASAANHGTSSTRTWVFRFRSSFDLLAMNAVKRCSARVRAGSGAKCVARCLTATPTACTASFLEEPSTPAAASSAPKSGKRDDISAADFMDKPHDGLSFVLSCSTRPRSWKKKACRPPTAWEGEGCWCGAKLADASSTWRWMC